MSRTHFLTTAALVASAFALGVSRSPERGPLVIDLTSPGDALSITMNGRPVGGLRVDTLGRLGIFGPNHSSTAVTLDGRDKLQIDPKPVETPAARLTIAEDVWLTGVLRVGRADAFGDAPFDPNGAIQLGRNLTTAQPMSLARFFSQGHESFRLGTTADGCGFISDGPHDTPLMTFRPSPAGQHPRGTIAIHDTELSYEHGTLRGRHPESRKETDVVPK